MPRLTHKVTGVTVEVSDEFADANKGAWDPVKTETKKAPAKSTSK
jgi:hypothetical protein